MLEAIRIVVACVLCVKAAKGYKKTLCTDRDAPAFDWREIEMFIVVRVHYFVQWRSHLKVCECLSTPFKRRK